MSYLRIEKKDQYFLQLTLWRHQETSMFLAVDPNMQNRLRAKEMENGRVDIGPTDLNLGYFTDAYYELKYTLHDHRIDYKSIINMNFFLAISREIRPLEKIYPFPLYFLD